MTFAIVDAPAPNKLTREKSSNVAVGGDLFAMAAEDAQPIMDLATDPLAETLQSWGILIDRSLHRYFAETAFPQRLSDAMQYSLFAGGKRMRPILTLMAAEACGASIDLALPPACAVEMVHTYSLIHDDLPAMDNDSLRRGKPTCHCRYDDATAILAGDGLLTLAFEVLTEVQPAVSAAKCVRLLAKAAGSAGMVGGQMDDLRPTSSGDLAWLQSLHARKTGALLTCSLEMGAVVASASPAQATALRRFGERIGLAFQIVDDLLDVEGAKEKLGKGVQKDRDAGKLTYPGILGLEESRARAKALIAEAKAELQPFGTLGAKLAALASFIVERDR